MLVKVPQSGCFDMLLENQPKPFCDINYVLTIRWTTTNIAGWNRVIMCLDTFRVLQTNDVLAAAKIDIVNYE